MNAPGVLNTLDGGHPILIVPTPGDSDIVVPGGAFLLTADYARNGDDLVLEGLGSPPVIIRDYFELADPPALSTGQGATISADLAAKLAGPLAPAQFAQAATSDPTAVQVAQAGAPDPAEAVGQVTQVTGTVRATRANGIEQELAEGDPIFQNDVLQTGPSASLAIQFVDDTLFSLGADARLVVDQVVFNPGGGGNELSLSLVQGAFSFLSGQIAPADGPGMAITSPVATIGIRGTTGAGEFLATIQQFIVSLLEGLDGELGAIDVFNNVSLQTLADALDTLVITGADQVLPPPSAASAEQLAVYSLALVSLGQAYIQYLQLEPEAGEEEPASDSGGVGSSGVGFLNFFNTGGFGNLFRTGSDGELEIFNVNIDVDSQLDPNLLLLLEVLELLPDLADFPVIIDLDGDNNSDPTLPGGTGDSTGFEVVFTEGSAPVPIADEDALAAGDVTVTSAAISLTNPLDGDAEQITIDEAALAALGSGITVDGAASDDTTIVLIGEATAAEYLAAIQLVRYENTAETPDKTERVIEITVNTDEGVSNTAIATIGIAEDPEAQDINMVVTQGLANGGAEGFGIDLAYLGGDAPENMPPYFGFGFTAGIPPTAAEFAQLTDPGAGAVQDFDPATGEFFYLPPDGDASSSTINTSFDYSAADVLGPSADDPDENVLGAPSTATVDVAARAPDDFSAVQGGDGIDILYANPFFTFFTPDTGGDPTQTLRGGGGDDFIVGADTMGPATDEIDGSVDIGVPAGFGDDLLNGEGGDDLLFGLGGNDVLIGDGDDTASIPQRLDVFLLQDLSGSFGDDLPNVRAQFSGLFDSLVAVAGDVGFGVGSFIDKPFSPFGAAGDFVYTTDLAITTSKAAVQTALDGLTTGFGSDSPEAQLEGLLQAAVREAEVGFRFGAQRFVVLSTDAPPHVAGDFGGASGPNNGDGVVDPTEDYPTIAQVASALAAAGITPIFAVTAGQIATYEDLVDQLGVGIVVQLSSDSSNLAQAVLSGIQASIASGDDRLDGGYGNDQLFGDTDGDLAGGVIGGNDTLLGKDGDDLLVGDAGGRLSSVDTDQIGAFGGDDLLDGGAGDDTIFGDAQDRIGIGSTGGNDTVIGGPGNDTLWGDGRIFDEAPGVGGADIFVFSLAEDTGEDVIKDFETDKDTLRLTDVVSTAGITVTDEDGDVTVNFGAGNEVVIEGIGNGTINSVAALDAAINLEVAA